MLLDDAEVLIMTALRRKAHVAHMNLDDALAAIASHRPQRAFLTHLAHDMGRFADVAPLLPPNVQLATDGLVVSGVSVTRGMP
ncbi:MAG: hypothetical protein H0U31_00065 [Chloroflexia bacterium]|nr:hypothetical protein [Chloroflexia bacterium]